jgi:inorganic pyrophosphatase
MPSADMNFADMNIIGVIIDTPQRSRNKYKFDPQSGRFKLSKILPEGMVFPYDFGFVPSTSGEDGDPLDALVLIEEPTFTGCALDCRLIGVIEAEQRKGRGQSARNDRLLAVARASSLYSDIEDIAQIHPPMLKDIEAFFVNYDQLRGVEFKVLGRSGPERAREVLSGGSRSHRAGSGLGAVRRVAR